MSHAYSSPSGLHDVSFCLSGHGSIERRGRCHAYEAPTFYFCLLNHQWQQVLLLLQCSFSPYLANISKHGLLKTKDPLQIGAGQVLVGEGGGVASATDTAAGQLVESIG